MREFSAIFGLGILRFAEESAFTARLRQRSPIRMTRLRFEWKLMSAGRRKLRLRVNPLRKLRFATRLAPHKFFFRLWSVPGNRARSGRPVNPQYFRKKSLSIQGS